MKKPEPQVGLVVRYDYLWCDEAIKGLQEGVKERPCAVIQLVNKDEDGGFSVLLAPITHTPPSGRDEGVEIPYKVIRYIGLDEQRQWIRTTELNRVSWDDPGIVPAKPQQWEYGRLPKGLYDQVRQEIQNNARSRKAQIVKRHEIAVALKRASITGRHYRSLQADHHKCNHRILIVSCFQLAMPRLWQ